MPTAEPTPALGRCHRSLEGQDSFQVMYNTDKEEKAALSPGKKRRAFMQNYHFLKRKEGGCQGVNKSCLNKKSEPTSFAVSALAPARAHTAW